MAQCCPVCYESFNDVLARRVLCGDVICAGCIEAELGTDDKVFYCPECGLAHPGSTLNDVSQPISDVSNIDLSLTASTSQSNDIDDGVVRETGINHSWSGYSSNSASETESEITESLSRKISDRGPRASLPRKLCSVPNCKNKASSKYCYRHSQKLRRYIPFSHFPSAVR